MSEVEPNCERQVELLKQKVIDSALHHLRSRNSGKHLRAGPDLQARRAVRTAKSISDDPHIPMCPVAGSLPPEVETKVRAVPGRQRT